MRVFELTVEPSPSIAMFVEPRLFETLLGAKAFSYQHCQQAFSGRVVLPWREVDITGTRLKAVSDPAYVTYTITEKEVHP